jgi:phosphatidylserine synthase
MNAFSLYALAACIVALVWTLALLGVEREQRRFLGVGGAWLAALVLAALWQAEAVPELWQAIQLVLLAWLVAAGLVLVDAVRLLGKRPARWRVLTTLALATLAVHVVAGLHFLWLATVSPGGV